jgi:dephospho-CoA kinase
MGKSAAGLLLRKLGVSVIDTDRVARDIVAPGQPALLEIRKTFGEKVLDAQGQLRRDQLGQIVFSDPSSRALLEEILHPRIRAIWKAQVQGWKAAGERTAVVIIPLLFETGAETEFDATLCVACLPATQQARLQERGWSKDEIRKRIAAQWRVDKKMSASTFVVWTEGTLDVHEAQLRLILEVAC